MDYREYQGSRDAVWRLMLECGITSLPVSVSGLCGRLGVTVKLYRPEGAEGDGRSMILDGAPTILVSRECTRARQRFTAAHELGHILLGHVGRYALVNREPSGRDHPIEAAANVFASRLLAPACVLWGCNAGNVEEIMALCDISRPAAELPGGAHSAAAGAGTVFVLAAGAGCL